MPELPPVASAARVFFLDVLLSMQGKIEFLRDLKVEVDIRHGESSYDIALIAKFDSMEDFNAYLVHPVRVEVSKYIAYGLPGFLSCLGFRVIVLPL